MKLPALATGAVVAALAALGTPTQASPVHAAPKPKIVAAADQNTVAHFNVYLPLTHQEALDKLLADQTDPASSSYRHWLTPAEFKAQFGPDTNDIEKVKAALQNAGFTILSEKTQNLEVEGPVSAVERTFATHIQRIEITPGHTRLAAAENRFVLPETLASAKASVPDFTAHVAHVHSARSARKLPIDNPLERLSSNESLFYPNDLNEAYQLPSFRTEAFSLHGHHEGQIAGVGSHIGIVISSVISNADLDDTFNSSLNLGGGEYLNQLYSANSNLAVPKVKIRAVDGGSGAFNPDSDDAFEASLDTQMSLGTAPGAKETIYNIPDLSDASIADGYAAINEDNAVDVVSSSFGGCEIYYTAPYNDGVDYTSILKTFHSLFQQGNAQGITFVASSGDGGATPCLSVGFVNNPTNGTNFIAGVESPASDPNVTAVGGTNLSTTATPGANDATYKTENANFDPEEPAEFQISANSIVSVGNQAWGSGGGFSKVFGKPAYQYLVDTGSRSERAVPDVSLMMGGCPGDADLSKSNCVDLPRSAVIVWVDGQADLLIGTSSSSPEMAGVLAMAVELNGGRLGNVNPLIYSLSALQTIFGGTHAPEPLRFFHREITGNNNYYKVKPGQAYSEVLGNSTLDVKNFLGLSLAKSAGAPDTKTNP